MALNFPPVSSEDGNPTDGMVWTAPDGRQWVYDASIPAWSSLAPSGNSNIVYRGGLDLTQDPSTQFNDIVSGNQFAVTVGANPVNDALYPGLGGKDIQEGAVVMFDGNKWQVISNIPYASESTAGIVELADESEAVNVENHRTALTPKRGSELVDFLVPQASTDVVGKTRYATQSEAEEGTEEEAALTPASIAALLAEIESIKQNTVNTGFVMWMTGPTDKVPEGWLPCDGRRIYPEGVTNQLYYTLIAWGNAWGNGPNSDVVRIPDLRGRFIRGFDDGLGRDPDQTEFGGSQEDVYQSHTHSVNDPGHDHSYSGYAEAGDDKSSAQTIVDKAWRSPKTTEKTSDAKTGITLDAIGWTETRPKNLNLTPVIKL